MGIFRRASSFSSSSSDNSGYSQSQSKVKASDLSSSYASLNASPNSRLLFISPQSSQLQQQDSPPLVRIPSTTSSIDTFNKSTSTSTTTRSSKSSDDGLVGSLKESTLSDRKKSDQGNLKVGISPPSPVSVESEVKDKGEGRNVGTSYQEEEEQKSTTKSTPILTIRPQRSSSLANSIPTIERSESPTNMSDSDNYEEEDYEDEEEESEEEDEYAPHRSVEDRNLVGVESKKPTRSRAATLVLESMESPTIATKKLNKDLAQYTFEDVATTEEEMKKDIAIVWKAMHLFMSSRMIEAEDICLSGSGLYFSVGFTLINVIKAIATFEPDDISASIQCCRDTLVIAQLLRKHDHGLLESFGKLAKGTISSSSIKNMTFVQRHAELIFAECTLLKSVLGVIYSGDFIAFLKEALNMRNAYATYRTLAKFVEEVDQIYGGEDPSIDNDFRSGVFLGNGLISLILSLLPATVLKLMTVFGFTGDQKYALDTLMKAGRWKAGVREPGMPVEQEGIRRQVCDMALLTHHLVIASYLPVGGVDIKIAKNILEFNLDRYPGGVFFLYFAGRLSSTETQLDKAVVAYHLAIKAQKEYIQLGHICYWDLGLVSLAYGNYAKGYESFHILERESNWSKAIYAYAKAVTLYEDGRDIKEVEEIMKTVPDLLQRIAGKSIPLEKFVARRARKFLAQGNRLTLPGIELAYVLNCLSLSPRFALFEVHLDQVSTILAELHRVKDPKSFGKGDEYWDDYCLAHLYRAVVLRFISRPASHVISDPPHSPIPVEEADQQAFISLNNVLKHGKDLVHDHHLAWFAHYELARLYDARDEHDKARQHYSIVLSGKIPELSAVKTKGKVSLQNMAVLRSNAANQLLEENLRST